MPSTTPKQARFMAAVAHGWKPTQKGKKTPPLKVAREFNRADTGTKMLKKGMKRRKKYQFGGNVGALGAAAKMRYAPRARAALAPQGREAMVNSAMRRPPSPGGGKPGRGTIPLANEGMPPGGGSGPFNPGPMPPELELPGGGGNIPPWKQPPGGRRAPPPGKGPGGTGPFNPGGPGGLSQMLRQAMQQRGAGGAGRPMPPKGMFPGRSPGRGGLSRYGRAGGFGGGPRRPQPGVGDRRGFPGRIPGSGGQNALLRTAGLPSQQYGQRLNRMMFARGGSVKKAIKALENARSLLHDSDPDFDHIADLLKKEVPEAEALSTKIKTTAKKKPKTGDPDEFRQDWLDVDEEFNRIKKSLGESD